MATKRRRGFSRNLSLFIQGWSSKVQQLIARYPSAKSYPSNAFYPNDKD